MEYIINNKYNILKQIGEGNFGKIYKGENLRTNELVAIKVEPIEKKIKMLKNEAIIYQHLLHAYGMPTLKWFGKDNTNYYLVITLLNKSLEYHIQKKGTFSMKLTLQIGVQIINLLKIIHDKGLLHRDIKPDNFLFGNDDESKQLYAIDFGLSKTYINYKNNSHIDMKNSTHLIGTPTYISVNGHKLLELSRRDDLESLGYMLIYFYFGKLKWKGVNIHDNFDKSNALILKAKLNLDKLYDLPNVFIEYFNYVRNLEFQEMPDYLHLLQILQKF
jgi:serine/threonine protein kinase